MTNFLPELALPLPLAFDTDMLDCLTAGLRQQWLSAASRLWFEIRMDSEAMTDMLVHANLSV